MKALLIKNATLISPDLRIDGASILVEDGKIAAIYSGNDPIPETDIVYDAEGKYVLPGFIDIHTHGAAGADVTDESPDAIYTVARAKLAEGCTSFAPTTLTLPEETLAKSMEYVAEYAKTSEYSTAIGVHLEGPYINPSCLGAQNPAYVRSPDIDEVMRLNSVFKVTQVSFAAEVEGGSEFADACIEKGIVPSCGHSKATYAEFAAANKRGLRHLTHFCNQMTPLHHRDIGLVGAGFLHDDVMIEMICDKIHLCPEMIRLAFAKKPLNKIALITDSMRASHLPDGPSSLGGLDVIVKDGQARLASNGALAGSVLKMNMALKNVVEVTGLPIERVVRTTAYNQAEELGLGDVLGKLEPGYQADIVVLDKESFDVERVYIKGVCKKCNC